MNVKETFVYTACPGWGDHEYCAIKTIVKDGKIVRTEKPDYTGPEAKEGFICQKGITSGRHPYLPGRLLHPLKRVGERGEGKWQQISWEQALDEIGAKLVEIRDKYGPESLALWNVAASNPPSVGLANLLAIRFGGLWGAVDSLQAYGLDNGPMYSSFFELGTALGYMTTDPNVLDYSKYIIVWGANPLENQQRIAKHLAAAQDRGVKVVDIGLVFDATAGKADWFIPVKPGSDAALALSMAYLIVEQELYDQDFLVKYTVAPFLVRAENGKFVRDADGNYIAWDKAANRPVSIEPKAENPPTQLSLKGEFSVDGVACKPAFQLLIEHLHDYTPEKQEAITGVAPETVRKLTQEYAGNKPAMMLGALGMRYQNQGESYRALFLLSVLTGNIGVLGGGATCELMPSGYPIILNDFPIMFPNGLEADKTKYVRQDDFFEQVKTGKPYPIKAFFKANGNPVHNCPNRSRWIEETFPQMDLIVEFDIWMTDTGEYADYVLPDCTSFERAEIIASACYNHIVLQEPAIKPLGEARDPAFLWREIAKRVGLGEYFDKTTEEWLEIRLQPTYPMIADIQPPLTMERLKKEKLVRAAVPETPYDPYASRKFPTESGRIEFYVERLADLDGAFAKYRPTLEVPDGVRESPYTYHFFSGRQRFFMQSLFTDDPWMVKLSGGEPAARMNPVDAAKEGLKDGDVIECFNQRGKVRAALRLDEAIPPGTVQVWFGWRQRQFEEGTYAELLVPLGGPETKNDLSERWWQVVEQEGKVGSFFAGGESALAGAWDTIWDCACDVRKVNGKNGGQS
jgi:anaerobic selenocysteine-containing dehydrogenase